MEDGHQDTATAGSMTDYRPAELVRLQRAAFESDGIPSLATRRDRLDRLYRMLADNVDVLVSALRNDYGSRPRELTFAGDIAPVLREISDQKAHLKAWSRPRCPNRLKWLAGIDERVRYDPLGVVGIAGPWNFPIQLCLVPAAAAIAAGNRVIIRPSSATPRTSVTIAMLVAEYFSGAELSAVTPEMGPGSDFSKLKFDGFFFTGSPTVGVQVAMDCAANLVPVTLELGGKNPAIVDVEADVRQAARQLARSRMMNSGQVCLSPDYAFVPEGSVDQFIEQVHETWREMFPAIARSPEYTAIINDHHFRRIETLVAEAESSGAQVRRMIPAGESLPERDTRKMPPMTVTSVQPGAAIEREEIFGPVLVVYPYRRIEDAIEHVNRRDCPLTLYWYGPKGARYRQVLDRTRTGSVNGNDYLLNMAAGLPFGGVGASGTGNYHGEYGFRTFTHARAVAYSRSPISTARLMSPPYTGTDGRLLAFAERMLLSRGRA